MPTNFPHLPPEIRELVLGFLAEEYVFNHDYLSPLDRRPSHSLAPYASVCHEWKYVLERTTFSSLCLCLDRLDEFAALVVTERRRRVRHILLHIQLPAYPCTPCKERESWDVKLENNRRFTSTVCRFFEIMHEWEQEDIVRGGISLEMSISSPSDFRNVPFVTWKRRRGNRSDIGDGRFVDSAVDFIGQDEEARSVGLLKPAHAITSFTSGAIGRRVILPSAYGEIVSALPCARQVTLTLTKERRLSMRKLYFSQFGSYIVRWPAGLESLILRGRNNTDWRSLPNEVRSGLNSGEQLCVALHNLSPHLKHLSVRNLVKIRELLNPVWSAGPEDRGITPLRAPDIPIYRCLETVDLHYTSLVFDHDWLTGPADFSDSGVSTLWRQKVAFAAARLAAYMPRLRRMTVSQRPLMWAGKHGLRYEVFEERAEVVFSSSFDFKPLGWVVKAWAAVARKAGKPLEVRTLRQAADPTDGRRPMFPSIP